MSGPLEGLLVIDLSRALAGPHAAMMLGDLGARVIKVERADGDDSRGWGPPFLYPEGRGRESAYFLAANRDKESIVLDLASPADKEVLEQLIVRADVLIENFRPGALDRLGFGHTRLARMNPRLVVLSITAFGHDGPEGTRPGYDQIAQGESGLMSLTGSSPDDPQRSGVPITDLLAGMYGAYGLLAALRERDRTGHGQVVRTSLLAAAVGAHAYHGTAWTVGGTVGRAQGNHHPSIAPYGLFRCADGSVVQLACGSENLWRRLCAEFGLDADRPGRATNADRVVHQAEVVAELEFAFAASGAEEVLSRLDAAGVPAGRVRTLDQVYEWEQASVQGLKVTVDHETLGSISLPGPPLRFFDAATGTETTRTSHKAPPVLDAHAEPIRRWLTGPGGHADPEPAGIRS